jgi:DNA-binding response OmpR family regulator
MDGLSMVRRIKQDPLTKKTSVIALTGCTGAEDRKEALEAGCDDYLLKPIDTRAFPSLIQAHLARVGEEVAAAPASAQFTNGDLPSWAAGLCGQLVREGFIQTQEMLAQGVAAVHDELLRSAQVWAGLASTLGYPAIGILARRLVEVLGRRDGARAVEVERLLRGLATAFAQAPIPGAAAKPNCPLPEFLLQDLSGKKVAAVGFEDGDIERVSTLLERQGAEVVNGEAYPTCDLAVAAAGAKATQKLLEESNGSGRKPVLLLGPAAVSQHPEVFLHPGVLDFAAEPWTDEELLARACRLLKSAAAPLSSDPSPDRGTPVKVVIADDDPTTLTLLRATLQNYGVDCRVAGDGEQALRLIKADPPDVAVLDVMMPNLDGFEVLAAIRQDRALQRVRVMLLTALQQEADVIRGFGLGADDYITKPFSPVEIAARLKRLVRKNP